MKIGHYCRVRYHIPWTEFIKGLILSSFKYSITFISTWFFGMMSWFPRLGITGIPRVFSSEEMVSMVASTWKEINSFKCKLSISHKWSVLVILKSNFECVLLHFTLVSWFGTYSLGALKPWGIFQEFSFTRK